MKKAFSGVIDGSWFPGSLICSFPCAFQEEDDRICGEPQILCSNRRITPYPGIPQHGSFPCPSGIGNQRAILVHYDLV